MPGRGVFMPEEVTMTRPSIETLLSRDEPLWLRLKDDDLTYRYGGKHLGWYVALLQAEPNHHGQRETIGVRLVKESEISAVLTATQLLLQQGDSSAGLPGVMAMREDHYQSAYRYGRSGLPKVRK
jgi:hypothetical protein